MRNLLRADTPPSAVDQAVPGWHWGKGPAEFTVKDLKTGYDALSVLGTDGHGQVRPSNPVLVVVRELAAHSQPSVLRVPTRTFRAHDGDAAAGERTEGYRTFFSPNPRQTHSMACGRNCA